MNWLLLSCIISGVIGLILAFVLGAFWLADRSDDAEYQRQLERDVCPWPMKERF